MYIRETSTEYKLALENCHKLPMWQFRSLSWFMLG